MHKHLHLDQKHILLDSSLKSDHVPLFVNIQFQNVRAILPVTTLKVFFSAL